MNKFILSWVLLMCALPAMAAERRSAADQMVNAQQSRMVTMPVTSIMAVGDVGTTQATITTTTGINTTVTVPTVDDSDDDSVLPPDPDKPEKPDPEKPERPDKPEPPKEDEWEKAKKVCMNNNIGVGNTFVWASKYSDTSDYSSMVEDVENPENNVCFVRVGVKSTDSDIKTSDLPSKYFEMGTNILCASWVDADLLRQRILDAGKTSRTWATVGGVVGGAAIGVGAMELFGNKLIGGAVQGQKALEGEERLRSQLAVLKKDNVTEYNKYLDALRVLQTECPNFNEGNKPKSCKNYSGLFDLVK